MADLTPAFLGAETRALACDLAAGPTPWPGRPLCVHKKGLCSLHRPGGGEGGRAEAGTHHDASEETDTFPTVCVGYHIPITNGKESDGDEPHGTQKVTSYVLLVMVPAKGKTRVSRWNRHFRE